MALTKIDRNLLKRCLEHEPGAWRDFVDRFMGLVIHVINHTAGARSIRLSHDDVEDLCAEILLKIVANDYAVLRHFRGQSSLATYLTVVCRRVCVREMVRRKMAAALGHTSAHLAATGVPSGQAVEQRLADREQVEKMMEHLEETEAKVVRLFHLDGHSYREISSELGIAENTIGPTLSRARGKMRRAAQSQA